MLNYSKEKWVLLRNPLLGVYGLCVAQQFKIGFGEMILKYIDKVRISDGCNKGENAWDRAWS